MATVTVGSVVVRNITRTEGDTDDIVVSLVDEDGAAADVVGWTAVLSIGADADATPTATFTGTGVSGGKIPINMAAFNVPIGSYKYDVRVTDTVTGDTPSRVYFKGGFKVTSRIN